MANTGFARMFDPRGVAIVGATKEAQKPGGQALQALLTHGYEGHIYPINPRHAELAGLRCFASVAQIDGPCDLAVVALPARLVPDTVVQCGHRGINNVVVIGGGFREVGPGGLELERRMLDAARANGVRIVGPNCLGLVNVHDRVYAGFGSITRPPVLRPGPVSAVIQSGGFGNSIVIQAAGAGVGFRYLVASGNETDISAPELIQAFVDDTETKVIFAYLEGIRDGRSFIAAARSALYAGKPLVVIKAGNSQQGLKAAASHTASMTGSYEIYKAAFKQAGVVEARDIGDAIDYMQCLLQGRKMTGRNAVVLGGSGGSAVNFCDAADEFGIGLGTLSEPTRAILSSILPSFASIVNPVDYTAGFFTDRNHEDFLKCLKALIEDDCIHALGFLAATAASASLQRIAQGCAELLKISRKPIMVFSAALPETSAEALAAFKAIGVPVLASPRRVAACMGVLADYNEALDRRDRIRAEEALEHSVPKERVPRDSASDEFLAKKWLASFGVPITRDALLPADDVMRAKLPDDMRFPVVVKIVSPDIAHKTDIGAVRLGISGDESLQIAAAEVMRNAKAARPAARVSGILVSEMVTDGVETIVGVLNDSLFGPVVAFGMGGILAESVRDVTYRIAPFGCDTAHEMIGELTASEVFKGVRGLPARDIGAVAQILVGVSELAWRFRDDLGEMDINPLLVRPEAKGVVAADVLILWKQ